MEIKKEKSRVYIEEDNNIVAIVTFPLINDNTCIIDHTIVHPSLRGKGVASLLLENAYEVIKEQNLKAIPQCSYAIKWFDKYKEKQDILK